MNYWLLLIPIFSACTGWLVIHLAINYLFHPAKPKRILGFKLQGILPAKQHALAERIGDAVALFFPADELEKKISHPDNLKALLPMIEAHIDDFLRNKLSKELPMIGMFIGDKTIGKVKEAFMKEIESLFPQIMKEYAGNIKKDFNIRQRVVGLINAFPPASIEKMLLGKSGEQLQKARFAGAIIGLVTGIVELIVFLLV